MVPDDVRQSLAELREPGGYARAARWLLVIVVYATLGAGLWYGMRELYFGGVLPACETFVPAQIQRAVEWLIGAIPAVARGTIIVFAVSMALRKLGCAREGGGGILANLVVVGRESDADDVDVLSRAGWMAIVGRGGGESGTEPQPTWQQVCDARRLTKLQAVFSATIKLLLWHWSQPVVYTSMLVPYRCYVASLGEWQQHFAAIVAAREVLYLGSTLLALWQCPAFLLMDPITAWREAETQLERVMRAAMYVLTPHNYVALCLANRFRGWERTFLGLAGIQVIADLASCFALGALLAGGIESETDAPIALIIGYCITASGFLLFFGPLSVVSSLKGAADRTRHSCIRFGLGLSGVSLLAALTYIIVLFGLLFQGSFNPYCGDFTFQSDACNGRGICFGAGQCHCNLGFGPEVSYTGEPLCKRSGMPCTADQLKRAVKARNDVCCAHHGTIVDGGCECELGFGPEVPDNDLTPTKLLCGNHTHCTVGQIGRGGGAVNGTQEECRKVCCSARGRCGKGACQCKSARFGGHYCQVDCGTHGFGRTDGRCGCESARYGGEHCEVDCGVHGSGRQDGTCVCEAGYAGEHCQTSSHFPNSRLLTAEWGVTLNGLANKGEPQEWSLCCSTYEGCDTATKFHTGCDDRTPTLTVAHNAGGRHQCGIVYKGYCYDDFSTPCSDVSLCPTNPGNFTFGGFVRTHSPLPRPYAHHPLPF